MHSTTHTDRIDELMRLHRPDVDGVQNTHLPSSITTCIFYEHTTIAHIFLSHARQASRKLFRWKILKRNKLILYLLIAFSLFHLFFPRQANKHRSQSGAMEYGIMRIYWITMRYTKMIKSIMHIMHERRR